MGQDPKTDDDPDSHGTMVASKALGRTYGVAKDTTLIPAKFHKAGRFPEIFEVLAKVFLDILARKNGINGTPPKAVIVLPQVAGIRITPNMIHRVKKGIETERHIDLIHMEGDPIITGSGNEAETATRKDIDSVPQVMANADRPLINVGAATKKGEPAVFSQGGLCLHFLLRRKMSHALPSKTALKHWRRRALLLVS